MQIKSRKKWLSAYKVTHDDEDNQRRPLQSDQENSAVVAQ